MYKPFAGLTVLVVEESYVIGAHTANVLEDAGAHILGPANATLAMEMLTTSVPDLAIIDTGRDPAPVYLLARWLRGLGVPLAFSSALPRNRLAPDFLACPLIAKPFTALHLLDVMRNLHGGSLNAGVLDGWPA